MTAMKRPGALASARAGEEVFHETFPNTALPLASQPEFITSYMLDRWLTVFPRWEGWP